MLAVSYSPCLEWSQKLEELLSLALVELLVFFLYRRRETMKSTVIFVVLTILGSLCQGKPVDKKKAAKLKDKPQKGINVRLTA